MCQRAGPVGAWLEAGYLLLGARRHARRSIVITSRFDRVRQFHNVVEIARHGVATDVENRHLAGVAVRDRLKPADALKLAFVGPVAVEPAAVYHFYRPPGAHDV